MEPGRDDFVIALRYAFLKKGTQQRFSLLSLIFFSIIFLILGSINFKIINYVKIGMTEIVYRSSFIVSGPENFLKNNYQLIVIPSMRTPQSIIDKAKTFFGDNQIIIHNVDKKAYLSGLKISDHIIVTCDSTSMISEAAITGKPIYVAQMPAVKNDHRFKFFFNFFC